MDHDRSLFLLKGEQDQTEDYCGLELYLSPEKGEQTVITSDLISEEIRKWAEPSNVGTITTLDKSI